MGKEIDELTVFAEWDKDGYTRIIPIGYILMLENYAKEDLPDKILVGKTEYVLKN